MKKTIIVSCVLLLIALIVIASLFFVRYQADKHEPDNVPSEPPNPSPTEIPLDAATEENHPGQIVLTLSGDTYSYSTSQKFLEENPHIKIEFADQVTSEQILSAMLSKSDQADVYLFSSVISKTYELLRDRGYCLPLASEILTNTMDKMYPSIAQYATSNGEICGMPYSCQPQIRIGMNMDIWHALGMTDDKIPTTWAEFLTFLRDDWTNTYRYNSNYALCTDEDNGRESIYSWILNDYNDLIHNSNLTDSYDTEEFRTVMEIFESIDFTSLPNDSEARSDECLFTTGFMVSPEEFANSFTYLPLVFREGDELTAPMGIHIATINPYSQNKEAAMAYIEYLATHIDGVSRHIMFPGEYEVILRDELPKSYNRFSQELAEGTDPEKINALINANPYYFLTTPRSIEDFRKNISGIHVATLHTVNEADYNNLYDVIDRYYSGGMTLDNFISQMDRMLAMRTREDG